MVDLRCPRIDLDKLGCLRRLIQDKVEAVDAREIKMTSDRAGRRDHLLAIHDAHHRSRAKRGAVTNDFYGYVSDNLAPPARDRRIGETPGDVGLDADGGAGLAGEQKLHISVEHYSFDASQSASTGARGRIGPSNSGLGGRQNNALASPRPVEFENRRKSVTIGPLAQFAHALDACRFEAREHRAGATDRRAIPAWRGRRWRFAGPREVSISLRRLIAAGSERPAASW